MDPRPLHDALRADPFVPFRVVTDDSKAYDVHRSADASVDPHNVAVTLRRDPLTGTPTESIALPLTRVRRLDFVPTLPRVGRVLETCLYADDLEAAEQFYKDVLGLEVVGRLRDRHVFFRAGEAMFLVFNPAEAAKGGDRPAHGARGPGHAAFVLEPDQADAWIARLRAHGVAIEQDLTTPHGGRSLYFRDPAGNSVELATRSVWGLQ